jgi:uncharacterized membrane protein
METTSAEAGLPRQGQKQKQINVGESERKASLVGGAALALTGLKTMTKRHYLPGLAMIAAGGLFLYRGKTGHCNLYEAMGVDTRHASEKGVRMEKVVTINRPPEQVYEFWRNFENLPKFMKHLVSVQVTGDNTTHWKAQGPAGVTIEWDAETVEDRPGEQISWQSVGEADVPNQGRVEFKAAPGGRGTEVKVSIDYLPPGGAAGKAAAKLVNSISAQQLEEDLKRLKQLLESGEIATAERTFH